MEEDIFDNKLVWRDKYIGIPFLLFMNLLSLSSGLQQVWAITLFISTLLGLLYVGYYAYHLVSAKLEGDRITLKGYFKRIQLPLHRIKKVYANKPWGAYANENAIDIWIEFTSDTDLGKRVLVYGRWKSFIQTGGIDLLRERLKLKK